MYYDPDFVRKNMDYNPETGVLTWVAPKKGRTLGKQIGYTDYKGYLITEYCKSGTKRKYFVHRICWIWVHGKAPVDQLDHVNGDKSDNRLCNLREATVVENNRNVGRQRNNTSGLKGVSWHKKTQKWQAQSSVNNTIKWLGVFDCPVAAFLAYQVFVDTNHGQFARVL